MIHSDLQFGRKAEVEVAIRTAIRQVFVDTRNHRAGNRQSRHGTQQLRDKGTICRRAVGHFYLFFFFKGGVGNVGSSDAPDPLSGYLVYVLFFRFRVVSPSPNSAIPKRDLWSSVRNPYYLFEILHFACATFRMTLHREGCIAWLCHSEAMARNLSVIPNPPQAV